jgi:hypothetical protein
MVIPRIDIAKTTKHGKRINDTRKNIAKLIIRSIIFMTPSTQSLAVFSHGYKSSEIHAKCNTPHGAHGDSPIAGKLQTVPVEVTRDARVHMKKRVPPPLANTL